MCEGPAPRYATTKVASLVPVVARGTEWTRLAVYPGLAWDSVRGVAVIAEATSFSAAVEAGARQFVLGAKRQDFHGTYDSHWRNLLRLAKGCVICTNHWRCTSDSECWAASVAIDRSEPDFLN